MAHRLTAALLLGCTASLLVPSLTAQSSANTSPAKLAIIPMPREAAPAETYPLTQGIEVTCASPCDADDTFAVEDFKAFLAARSIPVQTSAPVHIFVTRYGTSSNAKSIYTDALPKGSPQEPTDAIKPEGYAIIPDKQGIALTGFTASGVFYALQTAKQMIEGNGTQAVLHTATIRDWPALKYRGLHDDLSRGPFPTLDFMKHQLNVLAAYKVNIYSPYFEHTMQYTGHPLMQPPGGHLTQAEARELQAYAARLHILVIPEQEAFGHLHYLLNYEQYTPLAETPHGHVLAPGSIGSTQLIREMFTELSNIFPGPFLHIGADETVDLGRGATKPEVDARGLGPVYLDFMQKIVTDLKPLNRRLLFWGDIAYKEPALLKAMPAQFKKDTLAVAWEYNPHPSFDQYITPFTNAGFETWVAPGINNWSRPYPNYNYGLSNIQSFTAAGQRLGATGQLNTIWRDDGEAIPNNDWYGILFGAEAAWHQGQASIPAFQSSFGRSFHGDSTGSIDQAQKELMLCHQLLKDSDYKSDGSDLLFWIDPWSADGQKQAVQLRPVLRDLRLHAEAAMVLIAKARNMNPGLRETDAIDALELGARRFDLIGLKFQIADEMALGYQHAYSLQGSKVREDRIEVAHELNLINAVNGKLQDLRNNYSLLRDLYEAAWLKSNRPYFLRNNLERYDLTIQLWLSRIDKVRTAQRQWTNDHTIPPASDLGIPAPPPATK
ncbi:beta-N-acetylhexosaminidase [Terriglobus tenax]|uniref:beta-N-acetylhexosaminidase n=1 Tax=Terriglobus tenax TaxID=1111115 RepID=UPI0021DFB391|nr:beta-N-acetylhexosaminidase [Terriglobus tenax]